MSNMKILTENSSEFCARWVLTQRDTALIVWTKIR